MCVSWINGNFWLQSLSSLNLSNNYLFRLDDAAFATLPRLSVLDLSNNEELKVMDKAFFGLESSLVKLGLNNVSLTTVPELHLPNLRELRLSRNELPSIPQELAHNLTSLQVVDLSWNDLTNVPLLIHTLPHLRWNASRASVSSDQKFSCIHSHSPFADHCHSHRTRYPRWPTTPSPDWPIKLSTWMFPIWCWIPSKPVPLSAFQIYDRFEFRPIQIYPISISQVSSLIWIICASCGSMRRWHPKSQHHFQLIFRHRVLPSRSSHLICGKRWPDNCRTSCAKWPLAARDSHKSLIIFWMWVLNWPASYWTEITFRNYVLGSAIDIATFHIVQYIHIEGAWPILPALG